MTSPRTPPGVRMCSLCDRPAERPFLVVPESDSAVTSLLRLRRDVPPEGERPTVWVAFCRVHLRNPRRSAKRAVKGICASADAVAVQ